jgi:hypothetical protein
MNIRKIFRRNLQKKKGAALIIVLAFVVLLTGVTVAFLVKSISTRMVSNSSASQNKAALLAQSALDLVVSDLRQEIADPANSTVTSYGTTPNQTYTYVPILPTNAVPMRSGNPTLIPPSASIPFAIDPIPNLVRVSIDSNAATALPNITSKASAISSTTPAKDGRFVSPARWNSHYLIPRFNKGTAIDSTPDSTVNFRPPDWVLVSRGGPIVATSIGSGSSALNNPAPTNNKYVIGRYAFAIYDEGGLLDINVAGYPTPGSTPTPTPADPAVPLVFTQTQVSEKRNLAMADLTKLPLASPPTASAYLTQAQVDSIVGWRNKASGGPTGGFPAFVFNNASALSWFTNFAQGNRNGFLQVYGTPAAGTDQAFLSRKQLLQMRSALNLDQNLLQYLGTFSRSLEQPSFVPAVVKTPAAAPTITPIAVPGTPSTLYRGNNTAANTDPLVNASALSVRVGATFLRNDSFPATTVPPAALINATTAVTGEPLVKTRFPLSRLALVTASATSTGTTSDIYRYFGLTRATSSAAWVYNHGAANIKTLGQVAALTGANAREPDFAELLKAAITAGSLAKAAPNLDPASYITYSYPIDASVDYHVLQLMANLIDQYDTDSYPTVISSVGGIPVVTRYFRGTEDLPYIQGWRAVTVTTQLPVPALKTTDKVVFKDAVGDVATHLRAAVKPATITPGEVVMLWVPEVWNPHDPNTVATETTGTPAAVTGRPSRFRIIGLTTTPDDTLPWQVGIAPNFNITGPTYGASYDITNLPTTATPDALTKLHSLDMNNDVMEFSDDNGKLFREPTLLMRPNTPANSNITLGTGHIMTAAPIDVNSGKTYLGIAAGKCPLLITYNTNQRTADNPDSLSVDYVIQADGLDRVNGTLAGGAKPQLTFRLQYKDANNNWITYDEKYNDFHASTTAKIIIPSEYSAGDDSWKNTLRIGGPIGSVNRGTDPRNRRWGLGLDVDGSVGPSATNNICLEPSVMGSPSNAAIGASDFTVFVSERPTADKGHFTNYSNPCQASTSGMAREFRFVSGIGYGNNGGPLSPNGYHGLLSQNDPAIVFLSRGQGGSTPVSPVPASLYYQDADGVPRRAMGAYALTTLAAAGSVVGMPQATANTYANTDGVGAATIQSQSRPLILNRPFRSVAEMSYTFRDTPWKNIDFFTPESGDTALLDYFCVDQPPQDGIVAGKVNLNTRQIPVLTSILAGAYKDELQKLPTGPSYALAALNSAEATNIATKLVDYTMNPAGSAWRGPLTNIGELVGRLVPSPGTPAGTDFYKYQFINPATGTGALGSGTTGATWVFSGPMAAFDSTVFTPVSTNAVTALATERIQRFRESAVRPLVNCGQVRVWNLLIDVIAQTGRYVQANSLASDFVVEGEKRYWLHIAIDRYTGQVIDRQLEPVNE